MSLRARLGSYGIRLEEEEEATTLALDHAKSITTNSKCNLNINSFKYKSGTLVLETEIPSLGVRKNTMRYQETLGYLKLKFSGVAKGLVCILEIRSNARQHSRWI